MLAIKYTEDNLQKIADQKMVTYDSVREELEEAQSLGIVIYSVINFIPFGTRVVNQKVRYVGSDILETHYKFNKDKAQTDYVSVRVAYNR